MTAEEVLQNIEKQKKEAGIAFLGNIYLTVEEYRTVTEALEKQTPKKPIKKNPICYEKTKDGTEFIAYDYFCPDCNKQIKATEHHCKCGQALDWSDKE
jgi:Zn finger protein HypA/HybF involved in hydrogenase expression